MGIMQVFVDIWPNEVCDNRKYLKGLEDEEEDMGDLRDPYNEL